MAKMSKFIYLKYAVPQQKRGVEVIGELRFNIRSESTEDGGDDFDEAKAAMKRAIPARLRSWGNEKKIWHIFVTEQVRAALPAIFWNSEKLFLEVEQQLCLPGLEM